MTNNENGRVTVGRDLAIVWTIRGTAGRDLELRWRREPRLGAEQVSVIALLIGAGVGVGSLTSPAAGATASLALWAAMSVPITRRWLWELTRRPLGRDR